MSVNDEKIFASFSMGNIVCVVTYDVDTEFYLIKHSSGRESVIVQKFESLNDSIKFLNGMINGLILGKSLNDGRNDGIKN